MYSAFPQTLMVVCDVQYYFLLDFARRLVF